MHFIRLLALTFLGLLGANITCKIFGYKNEVTRFLLTIGIAMSLGILFGIWD